MSIKYPIIKTVIYCLSILLLISCGDKAQKNNNSKSAQNDTKEEIPTPTVDEDVTILQLSAYLIANPSNLAEEQQNIIINHAIDNIIPLERTNSGLFYRLISEGEGESLKWGNYISAHYKGYFLDGGVFDSSYRRDEPLQFYIGNMVSGWNEGLQLIKPGGKIQLFIPSALGYGEKGFPNNKGGYLVAPNTILIFDIEVEALIRES